MVNEEAIILYRFSEYRWINELIEGNISFSCAGNYIQQAKNTCNNIQGDEKEAVFARLHSNDKKIEEYRNLLKNDLEIIPDGDYKLLRRKSAKLKPIFCLYRILNKELKAGELNFVNDNPLVSYYFDERVFSGFSNCGSRINGLSDDRQPTYMAIRPKSFTNRICFDNAFCGYKITMKSVDYTLMEKDTFEIPLSSKYEELFYKHPLYVYQREARVLIENVNLDCFNDRITLKVTPFMEEEYWIVQEPIKLKFGVSINLIGANK